MNQKMIFGCLALFYLSASNAAEVDGKEATQTEPDAMKKFLQSEAPLRVDFGSGDNASFIQPYGVIDLTLANTNRSLPVNYQLPNNFYPYNGARINDATKSRTNFVAGGLQDSRFGVRGEFGLTKLDDTNIKLVYQFEGGFNPLDFSINNAAQTLADNSGTRANHSLSADSSLNGQFFGRQAWAGVGAGKFGTISYGNQYNPFFEIFSAYDPNGKADTFSPFGESGTVGGGGGISENARMHNSIKYSNTFALPDQASVNAMMIYQDGNAAGTSHGHGEAIRVGYENNSFGAQFAWNKFIDSVKAGVAAQGNPLANDTISATLSDSDSTLLALRWLPTQDVRISGGWEWFDLRPSTHPSIDYSTLFDQTVFGGVAKSALSPGYKQNVNIYFLGARYDFTQRVPELAGLTASLGYYATRFNAIQGPTVSTNSQGDIDTWTCVLDYTINRRFDTYAGYTNNHFSGDKYPSSSFYHQVNTLGAGLRMRL